MNMMSLFKQTKIFDMVKLSVSSHFRTFIKGMPSISALKKSVSFLQWESVQDREL